MKQNFKKIVRNIVLTIALTLIALLNIGCADDGNNFGDTQPDKGLAGYFWECVVMNPDGKTCEQWK